MASPTNTTSSGNAGGSLLARLSPAIAPSNATTPPAESSPSPRTRVRGARHRHDKDTTSHDGPKGVNGSTSNGVTTPSAAAKAPAQHQQQQQQQKGTTSDVAVMTGLHISGGAPSSISRAPATKAAVPAADISTSRWASSPPSSPPLRSEPKMAPPVSTNKTSPPVTSKAPALGASDSITAIESMLARLRTSPASPPEATAPHPKPSAAAKTVLGGRSMWADDNDDDAHANVPDSYKSLERGPAPNKAKSPKLEPSPVFSNQPPTSPRQPEVAAENWRARSTVPPKSATPPAPPPVASKPSPSPPAPASTSPAPAPAPAPASVPIAESARPSTPPPPPPSSTPTSAPPTPSQHINWADDNDDDGDLPELEDDWLVPIQNNRPPPAPSSTLSISPPVETRGSGGGRRGGGGGGPRSRGGRRASNEAPNSPPMSTPSTSGRRHAPRSAKGSRMDPPISPRQPRSGGRGGLDRTILDKVAPPHLQPGAGRGRGGAVPPPAPPAAATASTTSRGRGRAAGPSVNLFGKLTGLPAPGGTKDGPARGGRGRGGM